MRIKKFSAEPDNILLHSIVEITPRAGFFAEVVRKNLIEQDIEAHYVNIHYCLLSVLLCRLCINGLIRKDSSQYLPQLHVGII